MPGNRFQNQTTSEKPRLNSLKKKNHILTPKRVMIMILISVLLLAGIFIYASIRAGGIDKLFEGEKDVVSNTIVNIGTTFNPNANSTPTPTPGPLQIDDPVFNETSTPVYSQPINTLTLSFPVDNYKFTVKKDVLIKFINQTDRDIVLKFSNNLELRLGDNESNVISFSNPGNIIFYDLLDREEGVRGQITVI